MWSATMSTVATNSRVSQSRSRIALLAVVLIAAITVPLAAATASADTSLADGAIVVHDATPVDVPADWLSVPPETWTFASSCPADGACVAAGVTITADSPAQTWPFITVQTDGVWGTAQMLEFPVEIDATDGNDKITALECRAPGECDGAGTVAVVGSAAYVGFHFRVVEGILQPVEMLDFSVANDGVWPSTIACTSPGECLIGGMAAPQQFGTLPVEWLVTGGVAAAGQQVPLPETFYDPQSPLSDVGDVECPAVGWCIEMGWSARNPDNAGVVWVRAQVDGVWQTAEAIEFGAGVIDQSNVFGRVQPTAIECWAAGECAVVAVVPLVATNGHTAPIAAQVTGGSLGSPEFLDVSALGADPLTTNIEGRSVDCPGAESCIAIFTAYDPDWFGCGALSEIAVCSVPSATPDRFGFLGSLTVSMTGGAWSPGVVVESASADGNVQVMSIECIRPESCVMSAWAPVLVDGQDGPGSFIYVLDDGVWLEPAAPVPAPSIGAPAAWIGGVRCVRGGTTCNLTGAAFDGQFSYDSIAALSASATTAASSSHGSPMSASTFSPSDVFLGSVATNLEVQFDISPPEPTPPAFTG